MSDFNGSIGLPEIVAGVMVLALDAYVLTGGADFGGGVWDLLARGPRRRAQRDLVAGTIGPIWEANHVWLVLVVVMLFTGFPTAFGLLGTVLHIPLTLMLIGIVLRGSSFVFRSYGARDDASQRRWGRVFAIASLLTPLLLGMIVGAIASGAVGTAAARLSSAGAGGVASPAEGAGFASIFVAPWLAPFPLAIGALALAMFAYLAAVYLALAANDDALREDFRRRALAAAIAMFAAAAVGLALAHRHAPMVSAGLLAPGWALALQIATAAAALTAVWALYRRRYSIARVAAAGQVSLILWGWVLVQYPLIVPPRMTLNDAAAPRITHELMLAGLAGGFAILVPSLVYLFRTFASARSPANEPFPVVPSTASTGDVDGRH